ncbi:MAG: hypothetical protein GWO08_19610, partial [Gammaproteobacteria bacterium]|nr:hypothetical protein [Gammaproteobacteria bacterium]NIR95758.1 hypothetical protein [Gammaproteobacteria bacterium]NIW11382.1 hypothetical protein [Gammaproteobacteria bacterium]
MMTQMLIELEAEEQIGAGKHERTAKKGEKPQEITPKDDDPIRLDNFVIDRFEFRL